MKIWVHESQISATGDVNYCSPRTDLDKNKDGSWSSPNLAFQLRFVKNLGMWSNNRKVELPDEYIV